MRAWKAFDSALVHATEVLTVAIGALFTSFLCLGIVGRYIADFSVSFVEAGARYLLVWFFLLGAGLALRLKAHVGIEVLQRRLPRSAARVVVILAHLGALAFYAMVLSGTSQALSTSASTVEPSLGISAIWGMLSIPIGIGLLAYHQVYLLMADLFGDGDPPRSSE